eukprot:scaffold29061_cov320-Skeletonema_menzelii.AAC.1
MFGTCFYLIHQDLAGRGRRVTSVGFLRRNLNVLWLWLALDGRYASTYAGSLRWSGVAGGRSIYIILGHTYTSRAEDCSLIAENDIILITSCCPDEMGHQPPSIFHN